MPLDNDIFAAAVSLFSLSVFLSLYLSVCLYLCLSPIPSHTMYLSQSVPAFLFPLILLSLFLSSFLVFPPLPLLYPTECHSTSTLSFPYSIPLSHSTTHPHSHIHIQSKLNTQEQFFPFSRIGSCKASLSLSLSLSLSFIPSPSFNLSKKSVLMHHPVSPTKLFHILATALTDEFDRNSEQNGYG